MPDRRRAAALRDRPTTRSTGPAGPPLAVARARPLRPARARKACRRSGRGGDREPDAASAARAAATAGGKRVLKWVGIAAVRLDPAQLPRLRGLRPAAVVQALRRSEGRAARQPAPAAERADDPRARHRRAPARHPGAGRGALGGVLRAAGPRRRAPRRLLAGPVPRRHADADPRRRRRLPQTLDPARRLRRDPRPERRRRSTAPTPSAAPRCRSRRSRSFLGIEIDHVAIVDFTGFEDLIDAVGGVEVDVPQKLCADISGGAGGGQGGVTLRLGKGENTLDGEKALAYSRIRKPSECPGPGTSAYSLGYDDFDRERGPAGGDQRHQGPPHRPPPRSPTTSSRARSSAGTRRRPSSATWAS